ncbi:Phospholipase D A [Diplonema papillatum]|nr:Phospholipase D A [Diplonema papillatum]KAJ9447538.1 Phospholipase D A [Diplonema papillatum]
MSAGNGKWTRSQAEQRLGALLENPGDKKQLSRLLNACDAAEVDYAEMALRIESKNKALGLPSPPASEHSKARTPRGDPPPSRQAHPFLIPSDSTSSDRHNSPESRRPSPSLGAAPRAPGRHEPMSSPALHHQLNPHPQHPYPNLVSPRGGGTSPLARPAALPVSPRVQGSPAPPADASRHRAARGGSEAARTSPLHVLRSAPQSPPPADGLRHHAGYPPSQGPNGAAAGRPAVEALRTSPRARHSPPPADGFRHPAHAGYPPSQGAGHTPNGSVAGAAAGRPAVEALLTSPRARHSPPLVAGFRHPAHAGYPPSQGPGHTQNGGVAAGRPAVEALRTSPRARQSPPPAGSGGAGYPAHPAHAGPPPSQAPTHPPNGGVAAGGPVDPAQRTSPRARQSPGHQHPQLQQLQGGAAGGSKGPGGVVSPQSGAAAGGQRGGLPAPAAPSVRALASNYVLPPGWPERVRNLREQFGVPEERAIFALSETGGHAGKAARLLISRGEQWGSTAGKAGQPARPAHDSSDDDDSAQMVKRRESVLAEWKKVMARPYAPLDADQVTDAGSIAAFDDPVKSPSVTDMVASFNKAAAQGGGGGDAKQPSASRRPSAALSHVSAATTMFRDAKSVRSPESHTGSILLEETDLQSDPGGDLSSSGGGQPPEPADKPKKKIVKKKAKPKLAGDSTARETPEPAAAAAVVKAAARKAGAAAAARAAAEDRSSTPSSDGSPHGPRFACRCELLDTVGLALPDSYVLGVKQAWGVLAFFAPSSHSDDRKPVPGTKALEAKTPLGVIPFLSLVNVRARTSPSAKDKQTGKLGSIDLHTNLGVVRIKVSPHLVEEVSGVLHTLVEDVRASPFAPCLTTDCILYRDGVEYYPELAQALLAAKRTVFIAGWYLSPTIALDRTNAKTREWSRLDRLLQSTASRGVRVHILLYAEVEAAIPLASSNAAATLEALCPGNIQVIRHRGPLAFTHHQKFVVIDHKAAFVGGLDLAFGRYDSPQHELNDAGPEPVWQGLDYRNPVLRGDDLTSQVKAPLTDTLERSLQPRMPWHDVHMKVSGRVAYDVALNFIQRWNHHVSDAKRAKGKIPLVPELKMSAGGRIREGSKGKIAAAPPGDKPEKADNEQREGNVLRAQLIRSLGSWSGASVTERGIHNAMVNMIKDAKRSIYIENQFFISSLYGPPVINTVAAAIADRICSAAKAREKFRCVLLVQPHGEGNPTTDVYIQRVVHFQSSTLRALVQKVKEMTGNVLLEDYLLVACLNQHGRLPLAEAPVHSTVYIHSKLLIVDDDQMIAGSANINDRSLVGDRDSEIAILLDDRFKRTGAVRQLRRKLLEEHMGEVGARVRWPLRGLSLGDDRLWLAVRERMQINTDAYEGVFPSVPCNSVVTADQAKARAAVPVSMRDVPMLKSVKGCICRFPLQWLSKVGTDKSMVERAALGTDFFV